MLKNLRKSLFSIKKYQFNHTYGMKQKKYPRKYFFNQSFFKTINSKSKAYWLGFLAADGSLDLEKMTVKLALSVVDFDHIEKFQKTIKTNSPIRIYKNNFNGAATLTCCSKQMILDLIKNKVTPKKTKTLQWPKLKKRFISHFIRGYFDGDGCFWNSTKNVRCSYSIIGSEDFIKKLMNILCIECNLKSVKIFKRYPTCPVSHFHFCGKENCTKIYNYLYRDSNCRIQMDRKQNKAQAFLFQ